MTLWTAGIGLRLDHSSDDVGHQSVVASDGGCRSQAVALQDRVMASG
jgi:hypothetical protein